MVRMTVLVKFVDSLFTVIYNIKFHRCPTRTDDLGYLKLRSCYASPMAGIDVFVPVGMG